MVFHIALLFSSKAPFHFCSDIMKQPPNACRVRFNGKPEFPLQRTLASI